MLLAIMVGGLLLNNTAQAAETKVEGRIYATWWMYMNDTVFVDDGVAVDRGGYNQFSLDRSYMTMKSKLSDYTSVNITGDLRATSGFSGYDLILKSGYANVIMPFYQPLSLTLGLQPTKYPEFVDGVVWQRRYMEKNIGDRFGFLTTSDLGATINHNFGEKAKNGWAGLSIWNGTSYTSVTDNNNNKDINLYAAIKPLANNPDFQETAIGGQIYLGTQNEVFDTTMDAGDYKRQIVSFGGKFNYKGYFDIGADYWMNTLGQGPSPAEDLKQNAMMLFGALYLKNLVSETSMLRTLDFIARYDLYDPNTDSDAGENNENQIILGVECTPMSGVNASINYRTIGFEDSDLDSQNYLYFNTEFRF
jgi:hypothetical protein